MKRVLALGLCLACHGHDHESSERDTKGRSSAIVGADKPEAAAPAPKPLRVKRRPLLLDVNGDSHDDAVVVADTSGGPYTYAALDGMTGAVLWKSDPLQSWTDEGTVAGGWLLVPNDAGELRGFDFKSGAPKWTTALGERVDRLCEASDAAHVDVSLADKTMLVVTLATGEKTAMAKVAPCKPLASNRDRSRRSSDVPQSTSKVGDYLGCSKITTVTSAGPVVAPDPCRARMPVDPDSLDGIRPSALYVVKEGLLLIGTHKPGTQYPVVALLTGKTLAWKADVPLGNPLTAETGAPASIELNGEELYVAYQVGRASFITAFAVPTGHRDWHVTFDYDYSPRLWASRDTVFAFASTPDALVGYATADGAKRFTLGRAR